MVKNMVGGGDEVDGDTPLMELGVLSKVVQGIRDHKLPRRVVERGDADHD